MDSASTMPRLGVVRSAPLLDALRSHAGHPNGVCRHLDESLPWAEQIVTVASVVMNLAALRFHVASGQPCTHEHVQITLPMQTSSVGSQRYQRGDDQRQDDHASDTQIGTCQMSISSIFTPMNARMNASPSDR